MTISVANLRIKRIVVHQISKRDENGNRAVRYSDALTELDADGSLTLTERVTSALGRDSHSIEMMMRDGADGSTLQIAAPLIYADDTQFIAGSRLLADKLADAQTSRQIPGGLAVIFVGTTGETSQPMLGVIKAETHAGFMQDGTTTTLTLKYLANLLLTPQQKLYKIGLLVDLRPPKERKAVPSPDEFRALVYDHNMAQGSTENAAIYFYDGFLGCTIMPTARQLTKAFYNNTREFIDALDVDEAKKVDLNMGLHAYLTASTRKQIHVREFGEEYFPKKQLRTYQTYMQDLGFPTNAVPKDNSALNRVLKLRRITFSSHVKIVGPADSFKESVRVEPSGDDGSTVVRIKGTITKQA